MYSSVTCLFCLFSREFKCVDVVHSYSVLCNIPLYESTTIYLSSLQLMGIWIVSSFLLIDNTTIFQSHTNWYSQLALNEDPCYSIISPIVGSIRLSNFCQFDRWETVSCCGSNVHFVLFLTKLNVFLHAYWPYVWLFFSFVHLSVICVINTISPLVPCFFTHNIVSFGSQKLLILT